MLDQVIWIAFGSMGFIFIAYFFRDVSEYGPHSLLSNIFGMSIKENCVFKHSEGLAITFFIAGPIFYVLGNIVLFLLNTQGK